MRWSAPGILLTLSWALALWACNGDAPNTDAGSGTCPATYTVGDSCQQEELRCPYATSQCGLKCTCRGGVWVCLTQWCECSCTCGKILKSSCELLACSAKATNKCPTAASKHCEVLCWDAGAPDAGPDAGKPDGPGADLKPDKAAPDLSPDKAAPDLSLDKATPDQTPDAPPLDQTPDLPAADTAKAPDLPAVDAAPDAAAPDASPDAATADATPDAPAPDLPAPDQSTDRKSVV